jgi:mannose-6-phosphate isomerase-like protein (cupin superfamily)
MKSKGENVRLGAELRVVRREESLRSRQYRGVLVRVIYEGDSFEILRTEMESRSVFEYHEIGIFPAVHFIVEGSPGFLIGGQSGDLMPGDSIHVPADEKYRISNSASSRSVILSILFKDPEQEKTQAYECVK